MEAKTRVQILFLGSALLLSYARLIVATREYWWSSLSSFAYSWIGNYIGLILVAAVAYAVLKANESRIFAEERGGSDLSIDQVFYVAAVLVSVGSVLFVLGSHYVSPEPGYSVW